MVGQGRNLRLILKAIII